MRTYQDPELGEIIRTISSLEFPETPETLDRFNKLRTSPSMRCCSFSMQSKKWVIKLFLGGHQLILGSFFDAKHASRFADAAILRFWKYRKTKRACDDQDLNYGLAQAELDIALPDVASALCKLEAHLISRGTLKDFSERATESSRADVYILFRLFMSSYKKTSRCSHAIFHAYQYKPEAKLILDTAKEKLYELNQCMQSLLKL